MTHPFTISIVDDNIVECNERFNIKILSIESCGFAIGRNNSSIVTIIDNDSKFNVICVLVANCFCFINRSRSVISTITIFCSRK